MFAKPLFFYPSLSTVDTVLLEHRRRIEQCWGYAKFRVLFFILYRLIFLHVNKRSELCSLRNRLDGVWKCRFHSILFELKHIRSFTDLLSKVKRTSLSLYFILACHMWQLWSITQYTWRRSIQKCIPDKIERNESTCMTEWLNHRQACLRKLQLHVMIL